MKEMPRAKSKNTDFKEYLDQKLQNKVWAKEFEEEYKKTKIAVEIAELRERRGLTQSALAEKIGTTQSVIARLENPNYCNYTLKMLDRIAKALGAHVNISITADQH
jgi:ribosome-binding protein aMBF1 (putative translation factor)